MKLSRKFLSDYLDTSDIEINKLALDMTSIGNEFDECGKLINATNLSINIVFLFSMNSAKLSKLKLTFGIK